VVRSISEKDELIRFPTRGSTTLREAIVDDRPNPTGFPPDADRAFLAGAASPESVLDQVSGIGATLLVTETRLIVVRQGAHFRPRTGVRAWPLTSIRDIRLVASRRGSGSIVVRTGPYPWQAVNVFVGSQDSADAERIVAQIRSRARSRGAGRRVLSRRQDAGVTPELAPADPPSDD
jgi:hypothetical protein